MDDFSDEGELPGQNYFKERKNENEEQENNENDYYEDNYEQQDYQNYENYGYDNYNDGYDFNNNEINYDNYENKKYSDIEDSSYNNQGEYENNKNYYSNNNKKSYKINNSNDKYKNNYKYNKYNNYHHSYGEYNIIKRKESYFTSFGINFKLWLMLVIKKTVKNKKKIILTDNKKINKEIIDSFKKAYKKEANLLKGKENDSNNITINLKDYKINQTVGKNYNIEFKIIIEDKIDVFFVKKYIEIEVLGEIYYDKYPIFSFIVKQYKLMLDYNKEKENIIYHFKSEEKNGYKIGMCPNYSIKENEEMEKLYIDINGEKNMKDPQKEIRECLDNLTKYL